MQVQIIKDQHKEIKPKAFEGEENSPVFVFRNPNGYDFMKSLQGIDDMELFNSLFIEVKNLEFVDTDGNVKPLEKYSDIFELTLDARFAAAHYEIIQEISKWFNEMAEKGNETEKKVQIAYEIYKSGEINLNPRHKDNKTFLGDIKNPIAIGKKGDLWKNLDSEFWGLMDMALWIQSGGVNIDIGMLPYPKAKAMRYLLLRLKRENAY